MRPRPARRILAVLAAAACLLGVTAGAASAIEPALAKSSTPQPELAPFVIAKTGGDPVADALGPNHTFVIVYGVSGAYKVCVLARGARSCRSTATLKPLDGDSIFGSPQLYVSGEDVSVVMDECCSAQPETPVIFSSTNGGKTFAAPVFIGTTSDANVSESDTSAVVADGRMIWVDGQNATVDTVSLANPSDNEQTAASVVPNGSGDSELEFSGVGVYKGGVLVAASNFASPASTTVYYAKSGSDPGLQLSYHAVGTFADAVFESLEGGALITQLDGGSDASQLRLFNGTSFGGAHTVPDTSGGGPHFNAAALGSTGRVYILTERHQDSYDLEVESTVNGTVWTARTNFGSAVRADTFNAAIDGIGSGIIVASPNPIEVFPMLGTQSVSFTLAKKTVHAGTSVTATGVSSHPVAGRKVELERLESGSWHVVADSTETSTGKYTFHLTEHADGTYTFRTAAADEAGYVQYGYSVSRELKVD